MATGTYTAGSGSARDLARAALADIGAGGGFTFADSEIDAWIAARGTWQGAAAEGFRALAARVARSGQNYSNAEGSVNQLDNADSLLALADRYDRLSAAASATAAATTLPRAVIRQLGTSPSDPFDTRS
mgnify:FL=1